MAVAAATAAAFLPVLENGFVNWDDQPYLLDNPDYRGLGLKELRWMFTTGFGGVYQPLSWLAFSLIAALGGLTPLSHHLANLLLHALNAALVYRLAGSILAAATPAAQGEGRRDLRLAAAFAALAFSVHPLRVESVAWAFELRDLLSGAFCLWSLLLYLQDHRRAALLAFLLSLLAKATALAFPLALAVLDLYPLRRLPADPRRWLAPPARDAWLEKLPFLCLSLAAGALGMAQQESWGNLAAADGRGPLSRLAQAGFGLCFYLWKTALPIGLSPLYEAPASIAPLSWPFLPSLAAVAGLCAALVLARRRWPAGLAAWTCYAFLLAPVSGLVPFGNHIAADRYTYLACLPWALLAGAGLRAGLARAFLPRTALLSGAALLAALLGGLSWRQALVWRDSETLWTRALARDPSSRVARNNLGNALREKGRSAEAEALYREALGLKPDYDQAHYNLANALKDQGKLDEAALHFQEALRLSPGHADSHFALGNLLLEQGRPARAAESFRQALARDPSHAQALNNLGNALQELGLLEDAGRHYARALQANPAFAQAAYNLGTIAYRLGRMEEAARRYREALALQPYYVEALNNLGGAYIAMGRHLDAARCYERVLERRPSPQAYRNLAIALAKDGRLAAARESLKNGLKAYPGDRELQETLRLLRRKG